MPKTAIPISSDLPKAEKILCRCGATIAETIGSTPVFNTLKVLVKCKKCGTKSVIS